MKGWNMAQVVEYLSRKYKTLSSTPIPTKEKKERESLFQVYKIKIFRKLMKIAKGAV
jgi:hypothetical protein